MKTNTILPCAALLSLTLISYSCAKQQEETAAPQHAGAPVQIMGVICDNPSSDAKASIATDDGAFSWVADDEIAVYSSGGVFYNLGLSSGSGSDTAVFEGDVDGTLAGYAVYPGDIQNASSTASSLVVSMPAIYGIDNTLKGWVTYYQTYSRTPMVASCGSTCNFHHICGLWRLSLQKVPSGTSYLVVETDGNIAGDFPVSSPGSDTPSISNTDGGSSGKVRFVLTSATTVVSNDIVLNVPVPVGTYGYIKVHAYSSRNVWLATAYNGVSRAVARAHGKKFTLTFGEVAGAFAGVMIAPGNLYSSDGSTFSIDEHWYDHQDASTEKNRSRFSWQFLWESVLTEGRYGVAYNSNAKSTTGTIDLPLGGETYTWRLPTSAEWTAICGTSRTGSTVNTITGWHYAFITFENYPLYGVNQPLGLLLFPDKVSMSPAYTLPYHDVTTVNTNITASQLDEYLDAGCVFLPCAGNQDGTTLRNQGTNGYYWSSASYNGVDAYDLYFNSGGLSPADYYSKTLFSSVRLVREP